MSTPSQINLMSKLFPAPPYTCHHRRENLDLLELTNPTYREDFHQVVSTTSGEKLPFFQRNVGEYDDYEVQTLTYQEWMMMLRPRPELLIILLQARILRAKFDEEAAGIHHYKSMFGDWHMPDLTKMIDVPKLKVEIPEVDVEKDQS